MAKDKTGQKSLRLESSVSAIGISRVLLTENYIRAKNAVLKGSGNEPKEIRKALYEYIFSGDPEAVSPLEEITGEFLKKNQSLDNKLEALVARAKI